MLKQGIEILGITETKKIGKGIKRIRNGYWLLWSGVDEGGRAKEGVGLIIAPDIISEEYVNARILTKFKCPARVTAVGDEIVKVGKDHNHVGDAAQVEAAKIYDTIGTRAKTTNDTPQNYISEVTLECSQAAASKLPRIDTMKRSIRRICQQQMSGPALPNHRQEIEFQEEFTKTFNGEDFLLYDSGPKENHILIFSTRRNLQLLSQSDHWYADATFKTVPLLFNKLYTINGLKKRMHRCHYMHYCLTEPKKHTNTCSGN
ncbi:hypothetical protein QE152_g38782 [Popillia japonica]|uniref:Uncharacterized protein n=1 Tax=Popillia japonica TaxID=7064 RepID=A0AAW1HW00_POPJA